MDLPAAKYSFNDKFEFVVKNYNWAKPFSNFFPGIAGKWGVPMWIYYVSREQAICSMGIHTKDQAIMEFLSFNKALQVVGSQGFRTFYHLDGEHFHEPFKKQLEVQCQQKMTVSSHELQIEEIHNGFGVKTSVTYFPVPNFRLPVFVRKLSITNLTKKTRKVQVVDGAAKVLPYGVTFEHMKVIPRHIEGMMGVDTIGQIPIFRLKQTPADIEQVGGITGGYFYLSLNENMQIFSDRWIVDPFLVFNELENYDHPWGFYAGKISKKSLQNQILENRTPCAMTALDLDLPADTTKTMYSLTGHIRDEHELAVLTDSLSNPDWLRKKRKENKHTIQGVKRNALTASALPLFDQYSQQTFLENVMRGGMPVTLRNHELDTHFYVFHRQNGDLERDYHWFILEPTSLSQGNSHYRNILQNRRMDTWFFPEIFDENLITITNLIQLDGYNPLEVNGVRFAFEDPEETLPALKKLIPDRMIQSKMLDFLKNPFSPGELVKEIQTHIELKEEEIEILLVGILDHCKPLEVGGVYEGFWIDHWTYLLDMIEAIRMIYPDRMQEIFFKKNCYTYFDNPDIVTPRDQKTRLTPNGYRQYGAVIRDEEKSTMISQRTRQANKVRTQHGLGEIYTSNLLEKMLCIIANRISSLDARGYGAEMEAGKPGWLDSLNGLPGLFGSSICESLEIIRACRLLLECLDLAEIEDQKTQPVFLELYEFIQYLNDLLSETDITPILFWDKSHDNLEQYRSKTRLGIHGEMKNLIMAEIRGFLMKCKSKLLGTMQQAPESDLIHPSGVPYTYFINKVSQCKLAGTSSNETKFSQSADLTPAVFEPRAMSLFLEGPVHYLRIFPEKAQDIYTAVKNSALFDSSLNMYRCCDALENEPLEIGRIKAYANGWLENGSIYTHMEYKWLLEILKAGLYDEFFDEVRNLLVPFMKPEVYGRSTLENCSFIASSAFPDPNFHGQAFQPRLSGMTCEFLNIWVLMTAGKTPFQLDEQGNLEFKLQPILPEWIFTKEDTEIDHPIGDRNPEKVLILKNSFAFSFLGHTLVIYENTQRRPTAGPENVSVQKYTLYPKSGGIALEFSGDKLTERVAHQVREGVFETIIVRLG